MDTALLKATSSREIPPPQASKRNKPKLPLRLPPYSKLSVYLLQKLGDKYFRLPRSSPLPIDIISTPCFSISRFIISFASSTLFWEVSDILRQCQVLFPSHPPLQFCSPSCMQGQAPKRFFLSQEAGAKDFKIGRKDLYRLFLGILRKFIPYFPLNRRKNKALIRVRQRLFYIFRRYGRRPLYKFRLKLLHKRFFRNFNFDLQKLFLFSPVYRKNPVTGYFATGSEKS